MPEEYEDNEFEVEMPEDTDRPVETDTSEDIEEIEGFFNVMDTVPTYTPGNFSEQFVIYKSGTTRRLYWYDHQNGEWVYTSGTV